MKKNILTGGLVILILVAYSILNFKMGNAERTVQTDIIVEKQLVPDDWFYDTINFRIDSTLVRQYLDNEMFVTSITNESIVNAEQLYSIIEPYLNKIWEHDNVAAQKPFRINRADSVWIIEGSMPRLKDGGNALGGVFYLEVSKNGFLLKSVHGE